VRSPVEGAEVDAIKPLSQLWEHDAGLLTDLSLRGHHRISRLEIAISLCDDASSLCLVQRPGRSEMTKTISVAGTTLELVERCTRVKDWRRSGRGLTCCPGAIG
jgi:hypothetical protein